MLQIVHFSFGMPVVYRLHELTWFDCACVDLDAGKGSQVMKCVQLRIQLLSGVLQRWLYYATMAEERAGYGL